MADFSVIVIGAGVIGLSIACKLSHKIKDLLVIEKNPLFGMETSSRNSEVIHAGIYYPEGSLKAKLCVEGRKKLYEFLEKHNLPYKKTGKLIVAKKDEKEKLIDLYHRGIANGVEGLKIIEKDKVKEMEPSVKADMAIYSRETGIFDSHSFMKALYHNAKKNGAIFAFGQEVSQIEKKDSSYYICNQKGEKVSATILINSAGLYSDKVASMLGIDIEKENYKISFCKGDYFYYAKRSPVEKLIYPLPHEGLKGLGVHATIDLSGRLKFGPDAYFVDKIDYSVDENKRDFFYDNASIIIDGLEKEYLFPDTSGIRPKLKGQGVRDFIIKDESDKGLSGFINLIGIESPGLTASLAIGEYVSNLVLKNYG